MAELRDYLAAERTFLAWIRTGLALMGFGFVVARFGIFLQEIRSYPNPPVHLSTHSPSVWFGTALIAVGVLVDLISSWRHVEMVRHLNEGAPMPSRPSVQGVAIAIFLALIGIGMAIYLLSVSR